MQTDLSRVCRLEGDCGAEGVKESCGADVRKLLKKDVGFRRVSGG
jgi:hypothetical protein